MKGTDITNPTAAFQKTTTYVSGVDDEGAMHEYGSLYIEMQVGVAAVAKGDGLGWVAPTATAPVKVEPFLVAGTDLDWAGVAGNAGAVGSVVKVVVLGFCLVDMAAQTAAAGEILVNPTTTAGKLIRAAAPTFDATLVAYSILGRVFGVKNATTNLALCYVKP